MGEMLNKEQVIAITIDVLENIDVPVKLKEQIADHISGAVKNLTLALEMIAKEKEAAQDENAVETAGLEVIGDEPEADAE